MKALRHLRPRFTVILEQQAQLSRRASQRPLAVLKHHCKAQPLVASCLCLIRGSKRFQTVSGGGGGVAARVASTGIKAGRPSEQ